MLLQDFAAIQVYSTQAGLTIQTGALVNESVFEYQTLCVGGTIVGIGIDQLIRVNGDTG